MLYISYHNFYLFLPKLAQNVQLIELFQFFFFLATNRQKETSRAKT